MQPGVAHGSHRRILAIAIGKCSYISAPESLVRQGSAHSHNFASIFLWKSVSRNLARRYVRPLAPSSEGYAYGRLCYPCLYIEPQLRSSRLKNLKIMENKTKLRERHALRKGETRFKMCLITSRVAIIFAIHEFISTG